MTRPLVVGMGGSLRTPSTSLTALRVAVEGAADAGAYTRTLDLKRPRLPFYTSERAVRVVGDPPDVLSERPLRPAFDVHGCAG
ncbi:NAD(P)H-dependent oxidoreductase [Streptomyces nigra]